jgi:hypothetical protein
MTVIQIAGDDVRQVYIKVTGAIGLATLFVTQLPFSELTKMPLWGRWVLIGGLMAAGISAGLYFWYLTEMHLVRLRMAEYLRWGDAEATKELWSGDGSFWKEYGWLIRGGSVFFAVSVVAFVVVLTELLRLW